MDTVEYIELFWDCPVCAQSHISAVFNSQGNRCPRCFYWRVETIKLYEAPDSRIINDPTLINRKPFWVCKVCNAVNEDTGLPAHLLQCGNCDSYQVSAVGGITGNPSIDQQTARSVAVGEGVEFRENSQAEAADNPFQPRSATGTNDWRWLKAGLVTLTLIGAGFLGIFIWSDQIRAPTVLQVQVTDLRWTAEADIQEKRTVTKQAWRDAVPIDAFIVKSEIKQRGTRQEQRGSRTVMVTEKYQSGTRSETYYESERYQSGTTTETYYTSERYQSGTEQKCTTTSRGNGIGERTCKSVPVYSTREVPRTRSVPVYSTREVPRTRSVPVYSTREVPVQEPIMVNIPVQDTWVTYQVNEWVQIQTHQQKGQGSRPRNIDIKLTQSPPQRISATRIQCFLQGTYLARSGWFDSPEAKFGEWELPCQEYDAVNRGEQVQLRQKGPNSVSLIQLPTN